MDPPLRTLVVAPSPRQAGVLTRVLIAAGVRVGARRVETATELAAALGESGPDWDLVLCAPGAMLDAPTVVEQVRRADREVPVVLMSGQDGARTDAANGVVALSPDLPAEEVAVAVRRELALAATRAAARSAAAAAELRDHALAVATTGIVIGDATQRGFPTVYVNPAFERLTGWRASQVLGQSCALLQGPATDPAALETIRSALREGREARVTLLNYRRDGSTFWNELTLSLIRDGAGVVTHVIGLLDDVTARVAADDAERRHRRLLERMPAVACIADLDERRTLRYLSPQIEDIAGHPPEAFIDDPALWDSLIHPDDRDGVQAQTRRAFHEEADLDCQFRMIGADQREVHVCRRDTVVRDEGGQPLCTHGIVVDITSLRAAQAALREERDRAQAYFDAAGTITVVLDRVGRVAALSRSGRDLVGGGAAVHGRDWFDACVPEGDRALARAAFRAIVDNGDGRTPGTVEHGVVTGDGAVRTLAWQNTALRDERGRPSGVVSAGVDVTDRRRAEQHVAHLAYHDSLTGLPNRALLDEHLQPALARARRAGAAVALLYLDLDDFKGVNDSLGHATGDEVLRQVADRLERRRRATDLLARQGGDEFLLLIADIERDPLRVAQAAAEGMLSVLVAPFEIGGAEFHVGASVGISVFPDDAGDADALLRQADAAMYQAKAAGRNAVRAYAGDTAEPPRRLALSTRLRRALDSDELVLHWQPIVSPLDGRVHALEALVRWEDPGHGLRLPGDFIAAAEQTGLIDRVGAWVLERVCAQGCAWLADGHDVAVTMNVSPRELCGPDFARRVLAALERHGLDPMRLTLEVTESHLLRERARTEPVLHALAGGGVRLAIDDFGAGHTSLARLRYLPVHTLKLERCFMDGVPGRGDSAAVVTALLGMAAALNMEAVVDGVETEAQLAFLVERGCRLAQGFLLGRPEPASELALGRIST